MKMRIVQFCCLLIVGLLTSCEGFWGEKLDPSFIDEPVFIDREVAYVPIQPVWDDFTSPVDICVGFDELIYIADGATEEIIQYDQAGRELGRFSVPGLTEVTQDRSLDLLAVGTFDTLGFSLAAIYRIDLKNNGGYSLNQANIENKIVHPFYYKANLDPGNDDQVNFNGIAPRADNSFYVARSGPGGSQIFGRDDAVLIFSSTDRFVTPVSVSGPNGSLESNFFDTPFGITTLIQPPQTPVIAGDENDFVVTMLDPARQLKVRYIDVTETENGISYDVEDFTTGDTAAADGFLQTAGKFALPTDVTYTGDGTNYMFIVDREKDSLFQFTNTGLEGVRPPGGSTSQKNIKVSFGGTGEGLTQFNRPSGVAYYRRIVYVADEGNGRVLRFQLTTDFD